MRPRRLAVLLGLVAVLGALGAGCGGNNDNNGSPAGGTSTTEDHGATTTVNTHTGTTEG